MTAGVRPARPVGPGRAALRVARPPFSVVVLLPVAVMAAAAFINGHTRLTCTRDANGGGRCALERGSMVLSYVEPFLVGELRGAQWRPVPAVPFAAGPVWVVTTGDAYRFIDGDAWDDARRRQAIEEIGAFVADPSRAELVLEADARPRFFGGAVVLGIGIAGLGMGLARRRRHPG